MRADRLLSILMYLQTRGRTKTARLAEEFEVSSRTILRDLYALRVAGFPVYTERGPHGGCYLHEEFRNTLTQLTASEIGALFLSGMEGPLKDLGLSEPLRGAMLKLTAALPEPRQAAGRRVTRRVLIDATAWGRQAASGALAVLHQAAMEDRWVSVQFRRRFDVRTERRIAPYGLVAKVGTWYVVWAGEDGELRVDRTETVREATLQEGGFERPTDFDLEAFWCAWRERREGLPPPFEVHLRVRKDAVEFVRDALGARRGVFYGLPERSEDWISLEVAFPYFEAARRAILDLGGAVEVVDPPSLRAVIADFADQIRDRYPS